LFLHHSSLSWTHVLDAFLGLGDKAVGEIVIVRHVIELIILKEHRYVSNYKQVIIL
jgi:hypothetical protein